MNILLINTPSRKGPGGLMLPLGLLYLGSMIEKAGHSVRIYDPYIEDAELRDLDSGNFQKLDGIIEEYKPDVIGYGGIGSSYGRAKRISLHVKERHPAILQIAGGALSSVYRLILTKTGITLVFHGETEVSFPVFLSRFQNKEYMDDIPGVSCLKDGTVVRNPSPEQLKDLDTLPLPAYHLIDLSKYYLDMTYWIEAYSRILEDNPELANIQKRLDRSKHCLPIIAAKGCTHACLFCYRHVKGIRRHSVGYVINHIKYLKKKYDIDGFQICDELFNSDRDWVMKFCDALDREKLDIFYLVGGARVNKVDEEMLRRLRETGCIEINYGQESGSDTVLKEYRKGVTSKQNKDITKLTTDAGISCPIQLVIGSPGETSKTIDETVRFLKDLDAYQYSINYLIPFPETPIWKYVEEHGLIKDLEKYLDLVAEEGGRPLVNLTKEPDHVWRSWIMKIRKEMRLHYYKKKKPLMYYPIRLLYVFEDAVLFVDRKHVVKKLIPARLKRALSNVI